VGQKTHPKGFRLVTTQKHLSNWYGNKFLYSSLIEEDSFIRLKINEFFKDYLTISKVEISRITQEIGTKEHVNITVNALFPRAKEMSKKVNKYFSENVETNSSKTFNS
jgi:ribosomal protein S3